MSAQIYNAEPQYVRLAGALKAIRKNGRVVVVGMARMQITLDTMDVIHKQAQLYGSSGGTKDDVAAIFALLASGDVTPVVNVIDFDGIPAGVTALVDLVPLSSVENIKTYVGRPAYPTGD